VILRRIGNQEWIDAVGMNGPDQASRWRRFNVGWDRALLEEHNAAAKRIFDSWLEPLRDLGVCRVIEGIGSTDHVPFDELGIPAFTVIKGFRNYDTRTRHTNADLADAVKPEDLKQSAVVFAVMTWQAAMRDERIPRAKQ